jgi:uncharacterized protein
MLALLSPAKTLDFINRVPTVKSSEPRFLDDSHLLIGKLRALSVADLAGLMSISDALAQENHRRYADWSPELRRPTARQALFAFKGEVYLGMEPARFNGHDLNFAQTHLRILSGLHGVLRPLDLIRPYRLEMGTSLPTPAGLGLYTFWREKVTAALNEDLATAGKPIVLNLASHEYAHVIDRGRLQARIIDVKFLDLKHGDYKFLSFFGKKARGLMAAYFVRNRALSLASLKRFNWHGYRFSAEESGADTWTFLRDTPTDFAG